MLFLFFFFFFFFFNDTATTEIYTLSLHDALPIFTGAGDNCGHICDHMEVHLRAIGVRELKARASQVLRRVRERGERSEEHTSELQSRLHLVCRLLLEKKKKKRREQSATQSRDEYT